MSFPFKTHEIILKDFSPPKKAQDKRRENDGGTVKVTIL
jgi:hypothetical protein